jgi:translation elongation factor EF-G
MSIVTHVLSIPIEPRDARAAGGLRTSLEAMCAEDSTLGIETGPAKEIILKGISEPQLEWVVGHLQRQPDLAFKVGMPEVQYRETITRTVDWTYTHKQADPSQYAVLRIQLTPLIRGAGIETEIRCPSDEIPAHIPLPEFQRAIDTGIHAACRAGVVDGFPLTDLQAVILDAGWTDTDSTTEAFEIAARMGVREALPRARPWLLEPMMVVVALTPEEFLSDVIADFNQRRGKVQGLAMHGSIATITAIVPFANLAGYENDLRAMTQRRGAATMAFDHYGEVPPRLEGEDMQPLAMRV